MPKVQDAYLVKLRWLTLLLILVSCIACGKNQEENVALPTLPKLEIPENALLLYENVAMNDLDRSGNWRFYFREDGCFFSARNTHLIITDTSQLKDETPTLHWNTAFPDTSNICLNEAQLADLMKAINEVDFASLSKNYTYSRSKDISHTSADRWTIVQDEVFTVVVESQSAPAELVQLRTKVDQLIADALSM